MDERSGNARSGLNPSTRSKRTQHSATAATSLVFDGVTVVDVEQGKLVLDQRVVIAGNRARAIGNAKVVKMPKKAKVVGAQGKYLIPGLWDMHTHTALADIANTKSIRAVVANGRLLRPCRAR